MRRAFRQQLPACPGASSLSDLWGFAHALLGFHEGGIGKSVRSGMAQVWLEPASVDFIDPPVVVS